jgi:hypothetical protein
MRYLMTLVVALCAAYGCGTAEDDAPADAHAVAGAPAQRIKVGVAELALTACTAGKTKVKAIYGCPSWSETSTALNGTNCGGWDYRITSGTGAPSGYTRFVVQRKTYCTGPVCDGFVSYARKQCSCNDSAPCTNY